MCSRSSLFSSAVLYNRTEKRGRGNKNSVTFMLYNFTKIK